MASITVNVNQNDKDLFGSICEKIGMNISTAINVFIKAVNRTNGIPFDITANEEKFYSEENLSHIRSALKNLESGQGVTFNVAENSNLSNDEGIKIGESNGNSSYSINR